MRSTARRRGPAALVGAVAALVLGCFSETSAPSTCRDGEPGCDCRPGGACDAGLVCASSVDKCIAEDCDPGAENCLCTDDGLCLQNLSCQEGVCRPPTGTGDTGVAETIGGSTGASGATTAVPTTSGDPSASTTGLLDTGGSTSSITGVSLDSSTTEVIEEPGCHDCFYGAQNLPCGPQWGTCSENASCAEIRACQLDAGGPPDVCCLGSAAGHDDWNALVDCVGGSVRCVDCVPADLACS